MKAKTTIPVRKFICGPGRVKANGTTATPAFCYRLKVARGRQRKTTIELHSTITGRKIGYIADKPSVLIAARESGARVWKETPGSRLNTPEMVQKKMEHFLKVAQDPGFDPKATEKYRELSAKAWKIILREAKRK